MGDHGEQPKGMIDLRSIEINDHPEVDEPNSFILLPAEDKEYILCASSAEEVESWLTCIRDAREALTLSNASPPPGSPSPPPPANAAAPLFAGPAPREKNKRKSIFNLFSSDDSTE
eukprot:TRINITY_DN4241_c0_g1_i2.p2 TRINITY_DN4241_c0_g1~~TRINITY_DN4241_c0_g1_i2.p2  ORF type:complete len:126 (+),score=46.42 TRINITY_DN4241_c0_g1_i2:32-379(+)